MVRILDKNFELYISEKEIQERIQELATLVNIEYKDKNPLIVAVLNGAFMFCSDIVKCLDIPCEIQFVKLSSYDGMKSSGNVTELIGLSEDIAGRDVILVEDIVDTGLTLERLKFTFNKANVSSLKVISLLFKKEAYLGNDQIDYVGFEIANEFVVGYGLDYDGHGRNYNEIYKLADEENSEIRKNRNMLNLVLFGPPGAGKGTQAERLVEKYDLVHLSTGDIFRANMKGETELGKLAKSYIDAGNLVPDEVTISMLESEVDKNPNANGFIFDGFPRTTPQADALEAFLTGKGTEVSVMVALDVPEQELVKRLLLRGKDSGRKDDANEEVISNRIKVYNDQTAVVADYYSEKGKFVKVDGVGSIDEISDRLYSAIDNK